MEEPPQKLRRLNESEYTISCIEPSDASYVIQNEEVIQSLHMQDEEGMCTEIEKSRVLFNFENLNCDRNSLIHHRMSDNETIVYVQEEGYKEFKEPPNVDIPVVLVTDDEHTLELTKVDHSYQKAEKSPFMGRSRRTPLKSVYSCRHCKEEGVSNEHFKEKVHLDHIANCHEPLKCLSKTNLPLKKPRKVDLIRGTVLEGKEGTGKTEVANYVVDQNDTICENEISILQFSDKILQETIIKENGTKIIRASLPEEDQVEKSEWFENRNVGCHSEEVNPWPTEIHHTLGNNISSIQTMVNLVQNKIEKKHKKKPMMPNAAQGLTIDGKPIVYKANGINVDTKVIQVRVQPFPFSCYKEMALLCLLDAQAQISEETLASGAKPGMTVSAMAKWIIENLNIRVSEERMEGFILTDLQQASSIFKSQFFDGGEMVWTVDWETKKTGVSRKNMVEKHLEQIKRTIANKSDLINDHIKSISLQFYGL